MRMRHKKWAKPELAACPWFTDDPLNKKGTWQRCFPVNQPLHLELGCGKGVSTAQMVVQNPQINYVAMDLSSDVLGVARRNIQTAFGNSFPDNILLCRCDVSLIEHYFAPEDQVERIYINFCNPWPKKPHHKRRLTHPRQLNQYRLFLSEGGEIFFKTDDDELFFDSLQYFASTGFECIWKTLDLHKSGYTPNYISEHEKMFSERGIPIKFAHFRK